MNNQYGDLSRPAHFVENSVPQDILNQNDNNYMDNNRPNLTQSTMFNTKP